MENELSLLQDESDATVFLPFYMWYFRNLKSAESRSCSLFNEYRYKMESIAGSICTVEISETRGVQPGKGCSVIMYRIVII